MITQRIGECSLTAEFGLGERVFLRMAEERQRGLVTGVMVVPGSLTYRVSWGDGRDTNHYAFELTREHEPDYGA